MIASNFRKYPEAMAIQLVLPFGRPVWNGSRPSTRWGRALRAARAVLVAATPQIVAWVKVAAPQWWMDAQRAAKALAAAVRASLAVLVWDQEQAEESPKTKVAKLLATAEHIAEQLTWSIRSNGNHPNWVINCPDHLSSKYGDWQNANFWKIERMNGYRDRS